MRTTSLSLNSAEVDAVKALCTQHSLSRDAIVAHAIRELYEVISTSRKLPIPLNARKDHYLYEFYPHKLTPAFRANTITADKQRKLMDHRTPRPVTLSSSSLEQLDYLSAKMHINSYSHLIALAITLLDHLTRTGHSYKLSKHYSVTHTVRISLDTADHTRLTGLGLGVHPPAKLATLMVRLCLRQGVSLQDLLSSEL